MKYIDGKVVSFFTRTPGSKEKPGHLVEKTAKQTEGLVEQQIFDEPKEAFYTKMRLGAGVAALAIAVLLALGILSCQLGNRKAHLAR